MVLTKKSTILAADFETTVYDGQTETEVWAAAYAQLYRENVHVLHSIDEFMQNLFDYRKNLIVFFHNLRFDGSFIVNWLLRKGWSWTNTKQLNTGEFKTLISGENRWYSITVKTGNGRIEFRDSAKLMPMSLEKMGDAFKTEHRKLEMEYKGRRYAGCNITKYEMKYIINDVLVLKEALEFMINSGHTGLTIGSCAVENYKEIVGKYEMERLMPDQKQYRIDPVLFGATDADSYVRKSYKGGWCYVNKKIKGKKVDKGKTYDVNSLYPSVMHSKSGNVYPIGVPHFWRGDIPIDARKENRVFFVRFRCKFSLKEGYLPTVQIKGNPFYKGTEWLETSDICYKGVKYEYMLDNNGDKKEYIPTLTMTYKDYELFMRHYNVTNLEVLDGCWYYGKIGLFDEYIDYWMGIKEKSTGGARTEAKLFLNNLYGKYASSDDSSFRVPVLNDDGALELELIEEHNKPTMYIPIGTMVTSYARYFTITNAQKNYDVFCYSDTDSLHLVGNEQKGLDIHPTAMLNWKVEKEWSSAIFLRQKTYAEFIKVSDGKKIYPRWELTAAGMPERCKEIFLKEHPITDFKVGLSLRGKLKPIQIKGGVVLKEEYFTLRR